MSVIGTIMAKLALDVTNFSSNLSRIQGEIEDTGRRLEGMSNLGSGVTNVGKSLTTSLTVPIVGVGTAAVAMATDFEYSMSQVQAISGATGEDFQKLKDEAIELGGTTKFSAGEVADAMTEMAKAGWTTDQILSGMSGVLDAAAASGEDLGTVSTIVADAITGFGLEAADSTRVADLLTQAANAGTIGVGDLGESFKYVAPVAQSLGLNIEDCTTAISAMSMAGIKGSQAGTSLRTIMTNLVKPTDEMQKAMDELGISVTNSDGTMKSMDDIVANLRTSFNDLSDAEKANYAATLAGKEGMSGMLALLNLTEEEYNAISESMYSSNGVAQETAAVMQDNLKSSVEQLGGALESLAIRIGDQLVPIIKDITAKITEFTEKIAGASEEQIRMGIKIAAVVAAIGPLTMVVGKVITAFTTFGKIITAVKTALPLLKTAIAGVSAPVLAVVAAVALLVAAFVDLWKNNEEFRNKITAIWNGIKKMFGDFFGKITEKINSLGFEFENFGEVLMSIWKGLCDFLAPIFVGVFQYISDTIQVILDVILGVVDFFISIFKGDWEGAWNAVKSIFEAIWNGIVSWFQNIGNTLLGVLNVFLGWIGTSWEGIWNGIKTFFENLWNGIVAWFQGVLNGIATFFTNIWNGISTFFTTIWNGISTFFTNIINGIVTFVKNAFTTLSTSIRNIFNGIKDFVTTVWNSIKTIFTNILNAIKTLFTNILNGIKNIFTGAMNAIKTIATTVWNSIKSFFSTILNGIKSIFTNIWNSISSFFTGIVTGIKNTAVNIFNSMKNGIGDTIGKIKDTIVDGFTKAVEWIKKLPKEAITWGRDIIQGLIDGIKDKIDAIGDAVEEIGDKISSFLHFSVPDEGPLTKYESWMPDMIDGLAGTLKEAAPNLFRVAETVAGGLSNILNGEDLQASMAGAYGSVSSGTSPSQNIKDATSAVRSAKTGGSINIERIEVRDDEDIEELTKGLYDHNDKSLRAMGRRNL